VSGWQETVVADGAVDGGITAGACVIGAAVGTGVGWLVGGRVVDAIVAGTDVVGATVVDVVVASGVANAAEGADFGAVVTVVGALATLVLVGFLPPPVAVPMAPTNTNPARVQLTTCRTIGRLRKRRQGPRPS
jgi:hypothetical protein